MKRLALLAIVLALAIVLVLVWTLTRSLAGTSAPMADHGAATSPAGETPADPELSALANLERAPNLADGVDREELLSSEAAGAGLETWEMARSRWVEGTLRWPAGCEDPGPIEVVATAEPVHANRLAGLAADTRARKVLLARRPVAADGAFKLPFPPDTTTAHVSVLGRYLYLPASLAVDVSTGDANVQLDPKCGAWITGKVTLPADAPVDLAELDGLELDLRTSIEGFRGSPMAMRELRRTTKLAGGAFEFRAIPVDADPTLETEPERLAAATMRLEKLHAGRENPIRLELLRGGTIRGRVHDGAGTPLPAAEVVASRQGQWFGFDNREVRKTKSSSDGTFELTAVSPGKVVLTADAEGYLQSDRKTIELSDGGAQNAVELQVSQGRSISGRVAWPDGKPAPHIEVKVDFDMSQMVGMAAFNMLRGRDGKTKTDAEGAFVVTGLGDGPFVLDASAPPPDSAASAPSEEESSAEASDAEDRPGRTKPKRSAYWRAHADGVAPDTKGLELVLRMPVGLHGRVQDETGAAVTKFRIEALRESPGPLGNLRGEQKKDAFEDADGHFFLAGLTEGPWKLYAIADGFGLPEPVSFEVPRAADAPEFVVTIEHAASVAGVVKGPQGQRVSGAKVTTASEGPSWQAMLRGGPKPPVATTEADGTFLLEGLHAGAQRVVATSESFAKSLPVELVLVVGQRFEGVEILLREGGQITGEVFGENGKPAAGMLVQATQMKDFETSMTFSDAGGEFRIEHLLPGSWQVVAMPTRGEREQPASDGEDQTSGMMDMISKMKTAIVTVNEGEVTHVVLGAPPKDPVEVRGTVTHAGQPIQDGFLAFIADGQDALKGMKTAQVKKDGSYSLRLDAPGHYTVSVQRILGGMGQQSTVEFPEDIPETKEYRLDFAMPTARISGRVVDPDGQPAGGARISLHPESAVAVGTMWGGQYHEGATDSDGRFDIQMLRPGTYQVGAGGMSFGGLFGGESAHGRELRTGLRLSEGEWMKNVDFRLKKAGSLEVTVLDDAGQPAGEAAVFVREADGRLIDGLSMVTTKSDGKANYGGLGPGTYTVSARKDLLASIDSARVKLSESGKVEARISLQPGTILLVTCVGAESAPVRASLSVQDEDGREVGAMVSLAEVMKLFGEGGFSSTERRIGPLPQGKYKVRATSPGGQTVTKPVSLTGQAERKLTIRFD